MNYTTIKVDLLPLTIDLTLPNKLNNSEMSLEEQEAGNLDTSSLDIIEHQPDQKILDCLAHVFHHAHL